MESLLQLEIVVGMFADQVHVWVVSSWSSRAPLDGVYLLLVGLQVVHAVVPVHGPHLEGHVVTARGKKLPLGVPFDGIDLISVPLKRLDGPVLV